MRYLGDYEIFLESNKLDELISEKINWEENFDKFDEWIDKVIKRMSIVADKLENNEDKLMSYYKKAVSKFSKFNMKTKVAIFSGIIPILMMTIPKDKLVNELPTDTANEVKKELVENTSKNKEDVVGDIDIIKTPEVKKEVKAVDMGVSQKGIEFIKKHEKLREKAYILKNKKGDNDGMITIGYGHAKPINKIITSDLSGKIIKLTKNRVQIKKFVKGGDNEYVTHYFTTPSDDIKKGDYIKKGDVVGYIRSKYKEGDIITKKEAEDLLEKDLAMAQRGITNIFKKWDKEGIDYSINQNQFDALVSIAFNSGVRSVWNSVFIQDIKKGDNEKASESILKHSIGKKFEKGLKNRRKEESKLFKGL